MLINVLLVLGTLAVIGSWVVAVRILQSDKGAGTAVGQTLTDSNRRNEVLASTTL
jgi:hypothetical protein